MAEAVHPLGDRVHPDQRQGSRAAQPRAWA
jgi:hypothetical protein